MKAENQWKSCIGAVMLLLLIPSVTAIIPDNAYISVDNLENSAANTYDLAIVWRYTSNAQRMGWSECRGSGVQDCINPTTWNDPTRWNSEPVIPQQNLNRLYEERKMTDGKDAYDYYVFGTYTPGTGSPQSTPPAAGETPPPEAAPASTGVDTPSQHDSESVPESAESGSSTTMPSVVAPWASRPSQQTSAQPSGTAAPPDSTALDYLLTLAKYGIGQVTSGENVIPGVYMYIDKTDEKEYYVKINDLRITELNSQNGEATNVVTTLTPFQDAGGNLAGYSATTTNTVGSGRNAVEYVVSFDPDGSGDVGSVQFPPRQIADVRMGEDGKLLVRITADRGKAEYVYSGGESPVYQRADGSGSLQIVQREGSQYTVVTEYGDNRGSPADDRVTITLPDGRTLSGQEYNGRELLDGARPIATFSQNGRIETDFVNDNPPNKPRTVYDPALDPQHPQAVYSYQYNGKGDLVDVKGYDIVAGGERRVVSYAPDGDTKHMWQYSYDQAGKFTTVTGLPGCESGCTFEQLQARKDQACRGQETPACKAIKDALGNLKSSFWESWDRMRRAAGAGVGICGILDMFSVSCGDSLFPAYDDFLQNTVIGNVISGETSALCTMWSDNPPSGGNVALGPTGFASAWIAGESITLREVSGNRQARAQSEYLYKVTFEVTPSGIVDGECREQMITVKVTLGGQLVDLNFDNQTNDQDTIKIKCNKGGYSATGSRAVVRYTNTDPTGKNICLEFNGDLNSFFRTSLDNGKLCNRLVPVEQNGDDFTCSWCLFGETGFVEYEAGGEAGQPRPGEGEPGENRPNIGNPR